jgi:hypothetical protein
LVQGNFLFLKQNSNFDIPLSLHCEEAVGRTAEVSEGRTDFIFTIEVGSVYRGNPTPYPIEKKD